VTQALPLVLVMGAGSVGCLVGGRVDLIGRPRMLERLRARQAQQHMHSTS